MPKVNLLCIFGTKQMYQTSQLSLMEDALYLQYALLITGTTFLQYVSFSLYFPTL